MAGKDSQRGVPRQGSASPGGETGKGDTSWFAVWRETSGFSSSGNVFAASLAKGEMHPLAAPFSIDRFYNGALIDEHGAAGVAH